MSRAAHGVGRRPAGRRWRVAALATILLSGTFLWQDRGSLERGNRLFRDGDTLTAAALYRARSEGADSAAVTAYNLGTALLGLDPEEAGRQLLRAAEGSDAGSAQRGHYNLGYRALTTVDASTEPDSAIALLQTAVAHNRIALRLDNGDDDARWNLVLAQRMLDSLAYPAGEITGESTAGEDETRIEDLSLVRSEMGDGESGLEPEEPHAAENQGERRGAAQGAAEAWTSQDPGPLTEAEALRLVTGIEDGPERLIRGILWSLRPEVAWWAAQAYPGGAW